MLRRVHLAGQPLFPIDMTHGVVYIVRNPLDVVVSASHHYGLSLTEMVSKLCDETYTLGGSIHRLMTSYRNGCVPGVAMYEVRG